MTSRTGSPFTPDPTRSQLVSPAFSSEIAKSLGLYRSHKLREVIRSSAIDDNIFFITIIVAATTTSSTNRPLARTTLLHNRAYVPADPKSNAETATLASPGWFSQV